MDGQGKETSFTGGTKGPWRRRPSTILWVLSLGQLITWGLVYYTFPLFVVPMAKELGWSPDPVYGPLSPGLRAAGGPAGRRIVLDPGRRLDRWRPRPPADDRRLGTGRGPAVRVVADP